MFNPFDDRHRDPVKRRKSAEVAYDKRVWEERVRKHLSRALERLPGNGYVLLMHIKMEIEDSPETTLAYSAMRKHVQKQMDELGYAKMLNPKSKDGRWKTLYGFTFAYRLKSAPDVNLRALKDAVGM